jgi:serine/threonine protein kinase
MSMSPPKNRPEESPGSTFGPSDQLKPGKLFNCFELQRELEIGTTGPIWLAQNYGVKRHADQVALKFLPEFIVTDKTAVEDLKNEIRRRIPLLRHPNILRIYDLVENKGAVAVQLEYLEGQSLSHFRLAKPNQVFEVRDLEKWVGELCQALQYAHQEAGVIDGNIVPSNLLIDPTGNLKLKDFGLTNCITDSMSRLVAFAGVRETLPYQSPQRAAQKAPAITDDLYSLGVVLYELLTSKPPFSDGNIGVPLSMSKRRAELGIVGEAIPRNWEETVAACLAKDPALRPQSASEVERRLKNASRSTPNPQLPVRTPPIRPQWLTAAAIILTLALVSAVAFFAWHRLTEPKRLHRGKEAAPPMAVPSPPSASTGKETFLSAATHSPEVPPTPAPAEHPAPALEVRPTPSPGGNATSPPEVRLPSSSEANSASSPEVRLTPSPGVSPASSAEVRPTPSSEGRPTSSPEAVPTTSPQVGPPLSAGASPITSPRETAMTNEEKSTGPSPTPLSQHDIDATKEAAIRRINALPGVTAEKKANLIEKMHKARSMERLTVIPFDVRQATLRRAAVDELLKAFAMPELRDKLSDPTTILVIAGYADTGGRADQNLRISQERAENVSRILKEQAKLMNPMQTIGMGGTELLDSTRPDQNRAVEVWAVAPF